MAHNSEVFDIVVVGFGPAGLSTAISLHEQDASVKAVFLDKENEFFWRGQQMPFGKQSMRTNLLQDLVTSRNPLSKFTFINYLWATGTIVMYTNLSAIKPPRKVFDQYLRWCAKQIEEIGWVQYGQNVKHVQPHTYHRGTIQTWRVTSKNMSGDVHSFITKKVVVAVGAEPIMPQWTVPYTCAERVCHSSQLGLTLPLLQSWNNHSLNIAVIGDNEEALEVFNTCRGLKNSKVSLCFPDVTFKGSEQNPYGESLVESLSVLPYELRKSATGGRPNAVQKQALESMYTHEYVQALRNTRHTVCNSEILPSTSITGASKLFDQIILQTYNPLTQQKATSEPFDYVFVASGNTRSAHKKLLRSVPDIVETQDGEIALEGGYRVSFKSGSVAADSGIWLVDVIENGDDDCFSFLALRSQTLLESLNSEHDDAQQNVMIHREVELARL